LLLTDFFAATSACKVAPVPLDAHRWLDALPAARKLEAPLFDRHLRIGLAGNILRSAREDGAWLSGQQLAAAVLARQRAARPRAGRARQWQIPLSGSGFAPRDRPAMKVCFLYNHDAGHQVAHSIGIAAALARLYPAIRTVIAFGSPAIRAEIEKHLAADQIAALEWLDLSLPGWLDAALEPINRVLPARRLLRLYASAGRLRQFDLIVSTERTCLALKRRWGADGPAFVNIPHGSGDRNVAYHPAKRDFDLMLVSGQKLVDEMEAHGVMPPSRCRIIGYPKFDILKGRKPERFFANDNPVFLYNPHFDPVLSSWYDHGPAIIDWFAKNPQYNLIFAPHVMLFYKSLHISPEYRKGRRRPDLKPEWHRRPNILIDTNSERLFDMSYTLAADVYIGDMSSQVYEFLLRPRAVFFIDVHSGKKPGEGPPAYEMWQNGPVVTSAEALFAQLPRWQDVAREYRRVQERLMAYTIDTSDPRPASERGAAAIAEFLEQRAV